jgi:L-ribulose-5-phosphate 4-epimerase
VVIKPSGVAYRNLRVEDLVVLDLNGKRVEGKRNPSSDTRTHLVLYRAFPKIGGIAHTHSVYAAMFAQAGRELPCLGTTHADHFFGAVPVTRALTRKETEGDYEANTGRVIVERFRGRDPAEMPAVLAAQHGPFTWGPSPAKALENSLALETVAQMALGSLILNSRVRPLPPHVLRKHYTRKHGATAYYGQQPGI